MQDSVKVQTIDEYILTCSESVQPKLRELRKIIIDASPDLVEKISWNMPTFYYKGNVIHFAANKRHIGLYCGAEAVEEFRDVLVSYNAFKGTIQLPNDRELDVRLIQDIVRFNVEKNINK